MDKNSHQSQIHKKQGSLRTLIKLYLAQANKLEDYLSKNPDEWGKFQEQFNTELDGLFQNTMDFEKENMKDNQEEKVRKLKKLFIDHFRHIFAKGVYCKWSIDKPYGYAGDFKILEDIYTNTPTIAGFDRLFDNYFQTSAISVAVRNRKNDLKMFLTEFVKSKKNRPLRIMNLAAGSCREIRELLGEKENLFNGVAFDCFDNDQRAIDFAKHALSNYTQVNFIKKNVVRLALKKDITTVIDKKYDFIYSMGLFDYLERKIAIRLICNLKKLLRQDAILLIANVREKYSNPSVHFMEWAGDWNLIYRNDAEFKDIFFTAGFGNNDIKIRHEQQGIIAYIFAKNPKK